MRDIKLRFWDKENKSMVYQDNKCLYPFNIYKIICDSFTNFDFRLFILKDNNLNQFEEVDSIKMQWTGLKDRNGIKIYEGDIIEYKSKFTRFIGKIVYGLYNDISQTDLGYYIQWFDNDYIRIDLGYWKHKGIEVIGNVYKNPELLEGSR